MAHKIKPDPSLLYEAEKLKNGANTHKFNNLLATYFGFIECFNDGSRITMSDVLRIQGDLQRFIQEQRSLFYRTQLSYR